MKKLIAAPMALAFAVCANPAQAQEEKDTRGVYLALNAGISSVSDTELRYYDVGGTFGGTGTQDSAVADIDLSNAAEFKGTIGYDFGMVRADLEVGYSRNKARALTIKSLNGAPVTLTAADGQDVCDYLEINGCAVSGNRISFNDGSRLRQLSAMGNVWLDVPLGDVISPYVGGGIGVTGFEMDGEGTGKFAWQLGAGVAVKVSHSISITADFRHREVSGKRFPWDATSGFEVGRIKTNSFTAGLRFTL